MAVAAVVVVVTVVAGLGSLVGPGGAESISDFVAGRPDLTQFQMLLQRPGLHQVGKTVV